MLVEMRQHIVVDVPDGVRLVMVVIPVCAGGNRCRLPVAQKVQEFPELEQEISAPPLFWELAQGREDGRPPDRLADRHTAVVAAQQAGHLVHGGGIPRPQGALLCGQVPGGGLVHQGKYPLKATVFEGETAEFRRIRDQKQFPRPCADGLPLAKGCPQLSRPAKQGLHMRGLYACRFERRTAGKIALPGRNPLQGKRPLYLTRMGPFRCPPPDVLPHHLTCPSFPDVPTAFGVKMHSIS